MAIFDSLHVGNGQGFQVLNVLFKFKSLRDQYYRSIKLDYTDDPYEVARQLRKLAEAIELSEELKKE